MSAGALPLLAVEVLSVAFAAGGGESTAVDGVGFSIGEGEVMALVGSSAIRSRGRQASAIAIIARWRIPPDISCG